MIHMSQNDQFTNFLKTFTESTSHRKLTELFGRMETAQTTEDSIDVANSE